MKIPSVKTNSILSNSEESLPSKKETAPATNAAPAPKVTQNPKEKVSGLKIEGQMREAQVRSLLSKDHEFKMPGVEVKGGGLDDPTLTAGFKQFDKPFPSVKMDWPENAQFKEAKDKDGIVHRDFTDANGTQWTESLKQDGTRERLMTDKDGNRTIEVADKSGYTLRGGADNKGNSWTIDSRGAVTRSHSEANSNRQYFEVRHPDGERVREMNDVKGNYYKEKLQSDGKLERERGDAAGHKQLEIRDLQGFWIKGFADTKGNSYTVDKDGSSTRMHFDKTGINYSESSDKAGNRLRMTVDPKGEILTERRDVNGKINRNTEKFKAS
jgi:hypothetical protein